MKARLFLIGILLAYALVPIQAQRAFPYPAMPTSLHTVEQRASYLSEHYWDNFNFADTLALQDKELAEQGFVNFIDMLSRFDKEVVRKGIATFTTKAYNHAASKEKFESLIEEYCADNQSPLRNDSLYILFLEGMEKSAAFDETEKERISFKLEGAKKNLPGTTAVDFTFSSEDGKQHQLSDYKNQKVILYFYDPECENCNKVTSWLQQQKIPADITILRIIADIHLYSLYNLKTMPTIYLLDKGNKVILKDCTAEQLIKKISTGNQQRYENHQSINKLSESLLEASA